MPPKNLKVTDVAKPGRTAPPATARPIIVTNRPVIQNDPMIVDAAKKNDTEPTAPLINRTARTIEPMTPTEAQVDKPNDEAVTPDVVPDLSSLSLKPNEADKTEPIPPVQPLAKPEMTTADAADLAPEEQKPPAEDEPPADKDVTEQSAEEVSAAEAEAQAAEEARRQALEKLAESGTFAVPINAVQRKRSRVFVAAMCVIALVLAVALADLILDANLVHAPSVVPHTHLFSGN